MSYLFGVLSNSNIKKIFTLTISLCVVKILWVTSFSTGPTVFGDELLYRRNISSIFQLKSYYSTLCPPGYPFILVPSMLFDNWYLVMKIINVFLSSLIVPATWYLARNLKIKNEIVPTYFSAILPMHFIYPHFILSENLFVPLFIFTVAFLFKEIKGNYFENFIFGGLLGFLHLTKYLFLPAIPLFLIVWLFRNSKVKNNKFFLAPLAYAFFMLLWVFYAGMSEDSYLKMFGFGLSGIQTKNTNYFFILFWLVIYLSYLLIDWFPFLLPLLISFLYPRLNKNTEHQQRIIFIIFTVLLVLGYYCLTAIHSFGASYNNPDPQYLLGRYLMHVTPLVVVLSILAIEKLDYAQNKINFNKNAFIVLGMFLLLVLSYQILFENLIWILPDYFAKIRFNAVGIGDLHSYFTIAFYFTLFLCALIVLKFFDRFFVKFLFIFITLICLHRTYLGAVNLKHDQGGSHYQELASVWPFKEGELNLIKINIPSLSTLDFSFGLQFFNILPDSFVVTKTESGIDFSNIPNDINKYILVTNSVLQMKPMHSYKISNQEYHIYLVNRDDIKLSIPQIISFGPESIFLNERFNFQPDGTNALWIKVSSVSKKSIVYFDDMPLETTYGDGQIISAKVPVDLTRVPREVSLKIYDPLTNSFSNVVSFLIKGRN